MVLRSLKFLAVGAAFLGLAASASTDAWTDPKHTTYLTFNRPVALPGVQLPVGTYIFELPSPETSPSVVSVSSRDRSRHYLMAFTNIIDRPAHMRRDSMVTLGEASAASAPPVKAWFPVGLDTGREFIYAW